MKHVIVAIAAVVIIALVLSRTLRLPRDSKAGVSKQAGSDPAEIYLNLRNMALHQSRAQISLPPMAKPSDPWGVVMDMGMDRGSATVTAFSDGNASIYVSSGGGNIGGVGREPIRKAGQRMVEVAAEFQPAAQPVRDPFPLPQKGQVVFYLLTDAGVFKLQGSEDDLGNQRLPLSKLFFAGQDIITQYRLLQP